jgi:tRNA A-37 threonylcarbamoyl transferase component Bud32
MGERRASGVLQARIAVQEGMVKVETADRVLALATSPTSSISVGELLLQLGHIDEEQFKRLMVLCHGEGGEPEDSADRELFGEAFISRGLATPDQVADALREQAELSGKGVFKNLGEILVGRGILLNSQVKALLHEQDQVILHCPDCKEKYNVLRQWAGSAKCPADSALLSDSPRTESVGVAATLDGGPASGSPIGMDFGGCRIVEPLGKGSMGAVYKAKHVGLNRYVAVKLMPSMSNDPELVKRLLLEARAIAKLEHPNIVQVYDVGFQRGYFFMIMQLLKGETLEARIKDERKLPVKAALEIARDVAQGLHAAHERGVIHRDVKPANIMVTEDGKARLTDFGLAQDTDNQEEEPGVIVGTPFYMSPEQWLGHKADERSDFYSLGVILFLMVSGRHPFQGTTVQELMNQHLKIQPPSLTSVDAAFPDGLSAVVRKLMAKPPKRRYPSAKDMLSDLQHLLRDEDPEALAEFGEMVRCGFCETMNPITEKKCKVCHESLNAGGGPLEIATRADEVRCDCGAITKKGARSCSGCRKPFCTRCRVRLAALKGYCNLCVPHLPRR